MQEKDYTSLKYFEDNSRFADLLNGYLFHGRKVLKDSDIHERKRDVSTRSRKFRKQKLCSITRDIVREIHLSMRVMIVALENQTDIHYAMPVRVLSGDSIFYHEQWKQFQQEHQAKKDLSREEYLSGLSKTDRLTPALTIVLYFGEKPWDGPRCLKDMLDLQDLPEEIREAIADYPLHLLEVRKFSDLSHFETDLQFTFGTLQNSSNKTDFLNYIEANQSQFQHLRADALDFICTMTGSKELRELIPDNTDMKGEIDMCKALQELREQYISEGIIKGEARGITKGEAIGEARGITKGEARGILLAKKVFRLNMQGRDYSFISKECNIPVSKVTEILAN